MAQNNPIVIAHRGASGYLPEHTLESATLAFTMGADYVEQDLVLSKDGALIVLHDIHLDTVTDVEEKFPDRSREDGRYYALDFTLAEIKSLRVHERTEPDGQQVYPNRYQGKADFQLATFEEHIELVANLNRQFGKSVGLYTEIKAPAWHKEQGHDISKITVEALNEHGLNHADANIFMQCFDYKENIRLRQELGLRAPLIQLIGENCWHEAACDYEYLQTDEGLAELSKYVDGVGPWLPHVLSPETKTPTGLVERAHKHQLQVHPYTFRLEELDGATPEEALDLIIKQTKVDGLFTDFSDVVVDYLNQH